MKGNVRKSMTWLHTWSSVLVGWLLFAIFFTGTLSFFRTEITYWMQPEQHAAVPSEKALEHGLRYLAINAPNASEWQLSLPDARSNTLDLSWRDANAGNERRRGPRVMLNPSTGEEIKVRETAGGNFLYRFHFELYGIDRTIGRWIVGVVSMMMFVAIISGVIMHRKIFADFFMFRPKKKLLSWIDGHAISAVLALPFHIMITFSGLILLGATLLPFNSEERVRHRPQGTEVRQNVQQQNLASPDINALLALPISSMIAHAERTWQVPVESLSITHPGEANAQFTLSGNNRTQLSAGRGGSSALVFNAQGEVINERPASVAANASQATYNYLDMLHQARFADTLTRWLLFFAGILGTIMVGTGSVLWVVKRAKQQLGEFGFELVRGSNIGSIAGLMCATGGYFWVNRLLPADLTSRSLWEIKVFFAIWLVCVVAGFIWRDKKGWVIQLGFAAVLVALVPLLDHLTSATGLDFAVANGDSLRVGFDLMCITLAAVLGYAAYHVQKAKAVKAKRVKSTPSPKRKDKARQDKPQGDNSEALI